MERLIKSADEDIQLLIKKKKSLAEYLINNCIASGNWANAATACNDLRELDARIELLAQVKTVVSQLLNSEEFGEDGEEVEEEETEE